LLGRGHLVIQSGQFGFDFGFSPQDSLGPPGNDAVDRHEIMEILPQFIMVDSAKSQHFAFRRCRLIGLDENSSVFDPLG
jgi:hypothetical protein